MQDRHIYILIGSSNHNYYSAALCGGELLEDLLGLVGGGEVLFGGREVGEGGGVEDEAVARKKIVGGFEKG